MIIESMSKLVRRSGSRIARSCRVSALAASALPLMGLLPASAGPPSQIVEEHLIAQAGLSIGFGMNQAAQFEDTIAGLILGSGCQQSLGNNSTLTTTQGSASYATGPIVVYFDNACQTPYLTDTLEFTGEVFSGLTTLASTGQLLAPNGAILGAMNVAEHLDDVGPSEAIFNLHGTYKAVAGVGEPPVRIGLACTSNSGPPLTFACQEGVAQDFPALKMSLGTIANMTMTLTLAGPRNLAVVVSGPSAKLATGKLGRLSIALTSPTTLGFKGPATIVGSGSTSGASPDFGVIYPAGTAWSFNDAQHATKFSITTAADLTSSGKVTDTATHATLATFEVDKSGTGTITYSDKSKAKITNWTLSD